MRVVSQKLLCLWIYLPWFCILSSTAEDSIQTVELDDLPVKIISDFKLRVHMELEKLRFQAKMEAIGDGGFLLSVVPRPLKKQNESLSLLCVTQRHKSDEVLFGFSAANVFSLFQNFTFLPLYTLSPSVHSMQAFEYGMDIWLVTMCRSQTLNNDVLKMYLYNSYYLGEYQEIPLMRSSIVSSTQSGTRVHIAVATASDNSSEFLLYKWSGLQFHLEYSSSLEGNCEGLLIWHMRRVVHIAMKLKDGNSICIVKFDEYYKHMNEVQILDVKPLVMKHFVDDNMDYLICSTSDSLSLYWWSNQDLRNGMFLLQQQEHYATKIVDIAVHTIEGRMLIAVVFSDSVLFLMQNASGHYVEAGRLNFNPPMHFESASLWKRGGLLYMMIVSRSMPRISLYELSLHHANMNQDKESTLKECLENAVKGLQKREVEIKNMASAENLSELKSSVSSNAKRKIEKLRLESERKYFVTLYSLHKRLLNTANSLKAGLHKYLLRSSDQEIDSDVHFRSVTFESAKHLELTHHTRINNIPTQRLHQVLKTKGNQTFLGKVSTEYVRCGMMLTNFLNQKKPTDFVVLNDFLLRLDGFYKFANITTKNVHILGRKINDLNLQNFVLASKEQNLTYTKEFKNLTAFSIRTGGNINNIQMKKEAIVYTDSMNIRSKLNFTAKFIVKGNLNVSSVNGHQLSHLFSRSVRKSTDQSITGQKFFKSMRIEGNLTIFEKINNVFPSNLMTWNTNQAVFGNIHFLGSPTFQNIYATKVNNLNLISDVVLKGSSTNIKGRKIFEQTLNVRNITMRDGVVIDEFDPSAEVPEIVNGGDISNPVNVTNIVVENDAEINENSESFPLFDFIHNVWLNRTEQNISYINVEKMSLNGLQVSKVNNLTMEDFILVNSNSTIVSSKNFKDDISMNTLHLKEGKVLDFAKLSNMKLKVSDNFTLESAVFKENLHIDGTINGMDEFLHADKFQVIKGDMKIGTIHAEDLKLRELNLEMFKNVNFKDFMDNAVMLSSEIRLNNKNFSHIEGSSLNCSACMSDVDFEKVVTLNTYQKINANMTFNTPVSFKKMEVKQFLNGVKLDEIVYVDEVQKVSNKLFEGLWRVPNLTVQQYVNGINITDLATNIFNKSADSNFNESVTINSTIHVKDLQIEENSTLDGVNLRDSILLNESTSLVSLKASSIVAKDVNVIGHVNGYNLTSLVQDAIRAESDDVQYIRQQMKLDALEVQGNLYLEYINGIWMQDLISSLKRSSCNEFEDGAVFEDIAVDNLEIRNSLNNLYIADIVNDTVRRSIPQVIEGRKKFLKINARNANIRFLRSNLTCGVDVSKLNESFVRRSIPNQIVEVKKLGSIRANRVTVKGTLNTLKLPEDVVLVNTSEHISHNVTINATINDIAMHVPNLKVFGNINGIGVVKFLQERVTLRGEQFIQADFVFTNDTRIDDVAIIHGYVNDINFKELERTSRSRTIHGAITFTNNLTVNSNLEVTGTVNKISIKDIESKLYQATRNESVKDTIQFSKVKTPSLYCDKINGFDVLGFYNSTNNLIHIVKDSLDDLNSIIKGYRSELFEQVELSKHPMSVFGYFELQQNLQCHLNFSVIEKFLPVYVYGFNGTIYDLQKTRMIIWVNRNDNKGCLGTTSLIFDVFENGTLKKTEEQRGKLFEFFTTFYWEGILGLYVLESDSCFDEPESLIIGTQLFNESVFQVVKSPHYAVLKEAKLLEMDDIFLMLAFTMQVSEPQERIQLYKYDVKENSWALHQQFYDKDLISLDWTVVYPSEPSTFHVLPKYYLVVVGSSTNASVTLYQWKYEKNEFAFVTHLNASTSVNGIWVKADGNLLLLLAKEYTKLKKDHSSLTVYTEPLEVYSLKNDVLILNHTLMLNGVKSLETFTLAGESFVLASSPHLETLYVLQYRGYNGFDVVQEILCPGITSTSIFTAGNNYYVAINSAIGQSKILKGVIREPNIIK